MICQGCGYANPVTTAFCVQCGSSQQVQAFAAGVGEAQPVSRTVSERAAFVPGGISGVHADATPYAPFLKRFVAFVLDEFLAGALAAVTYFMMAALAAASGASGLQQGYGAGYRTGVGLGAGLFFLVVGGFLAFAAYVFYFVKQETGPRQATLGKALLGIRITTTAGSTISVGQSLGRLII